MPTSVPKPSSSGFLVVVVVVCVVVVVVAFVVVVVVAFVVVVVVAFLVVAFVVVVVAACVVVGVAAFVVAPAFFVVVDLLPSVVVEEAAVESVSVSDDSVVSSVSISIPMLSIIRLCSSDNRSFSFFSSSITSWQRP